LSNGKSWKKRDRRGHFVYIEKKKLIAQISETQKGVFKKEKKEREGKNFPKTEKRGVFIDERGGHPKARRISHAKKTTKKEKKRSLAFGFRSGEIYRKHQNEAPTGLRKVGSKNFPKGLFKPISKRG